MVAFLRLFSKPDLSSYLTASKSAMRELLAERFNSKTLKTFYSNDEFVSTKPNTGILNFLASNTAFNSTLGSITNKA